MSGVHFYLACLGFATGIFVRTFYIYGFPEILWGFFIASAFLFICRRKRAAFSANVLQTFSLFLFCFLIGSLRMGYAEYAYTSSLVEANTESVTFEGVVVREPDVRERIQQLTVSGNGELFLVSTDKYQNIAYGDRVRVNGEMKLPEVFETEFGREFNYPNYLKARGITHLMPFAGVTTLDENVGNPILIALLKIKHQFLQKLEEVIPSPQVALGEGLLLGVKQSLGDELEGAFRTTGIMHIVVLSGYNMMLVIAFVGYLLAFTKSERMHILFGVLSILAFASMVGFSASVMRASAMALLLLLSQATGRTYAVVRALILTGIVMLLFNPYLLAFDIGFQFSFLATLGLILVSPYVESYVQFVPKLFHLRTFLTSTIAVQIFLTPLLLYHIGEFSVLAVPVNLLVLPMVAVAMLFTFLTGLFAFISLPVASLFGYGAYLSLSYIINIATFFASLPFASFIVPAFPFWVVILCYLLFSYALWRVLRAGVSKEGEIVQKLSQWTIIDESEIKLKYATQNTTTTTAPRLLVE